MKWTDKEKRWLRDNHTKGKLSLAYEFEAKFGYARSPSSIYTMRRMEQVPGYRERNRENTRNRASKNKEYIDAYKLKHPCLICGEREPIALDFHHVDPSIKSFEISSKTCSLTQLKEEIGKCAVLCANCHRKVHGQILDLDDYL